MSLPQRQDHLGTHGGFRIQLGNNSNSTGSSSTPQFAAINARKGSPSPLSNSLIPRDYLGARQNSPKDKQLFDADILGHDFPQKSHFTGGQDIHDNEKSAGLSGSSQHRPLQRQTTQSPPESPASSTFSAKSEPRRDTGTMPRTSSIDSAISSISTASQPKTSAEAKDATIPEIRNLIATAGSAENLIQHLLRDKQQAASQNAQLWRLVDKQRALLLGLNKDLERLTKEKERYKRKLKESQEQASSQAETKARKDSQSPRAAQDMEAARAEAAEGVMEEAQDRNDVLSTPDNKTKQVTDSSPMDPAMMPLPLHMLQSSTESDLQTHQTSEMIPLIIEEDDQNLPDERNQQNAQPGDPHHDQSQISTTHHEEHERVKPLLLMPIASGPPSFNLIEPSPLNPSPSSSFPPTRKPPPAPLQLEDNKRDTVFEEDLGSNDNSEIPVENNNQLVDSPGSVRGRRKTREDDDRDREAAALAEKEARSRSKKEKKKSKSPEPESEPAMGEPLLKPSFPVVGLPSSPRHPPPNLQGGLAPPASITGVLQSHAATKKSGAESGLAPRPLSPGLPTSPRPTDRPPGSPMPRKPRETGGVAMTVPLSPRSIMSGFLSPRSARQPVTLPSSPRPNQPNHVPVSSRVLARDTEQDASPSNSTGVVVPEVYQGLVSDEYPDFLLPPNALPSIQIKVTSSRLRPSRLSFIGARPQEDNSIFTLSVFSRSDGRELWRLEKIILALPQLDQRLRPLCKSVPSLPDRKLFNGHSPAIMDARRAALDEYFDELLDTEMDEDAAKLVCGFLSTDVIEPRGSGISGLGNMDVGDSTASIGPDGRTCRTGYLTKRGKNFGGWKARYFVLENPELKYYESPGGVHLGTIKLVNAQIGRQSHNESSTQSTEEDNQYRHAFLILEPKRKDSASHVRHVLCAESDKERDEWVTALLTYTTEGNHSASDRITVASSQGSKSMLSNPSLSSLDRDTHSEESQLRTVQYEDTVASVPPFQGSNTSASQKDSTPTSSSVSLANGQHNLNISGPINATVIADAGQWGNKQAATLASKDKDQRKRNIFHFKQKNSSDMLHPGSAPVESAQGVGQSQSSSPMKSSVRPVFGLPLAEAVELCAPIGVDVGLPAVVYRCIEYLRNKEAANEEGLFRLSGSNVLIRQLKERFNTEGDVDLLTETEYYDVHAVASLFKTYLRELPNPILTRELHLEFLRVLDMDDHAQKVALYNSLVNRLPSANYNLLKTLAEYLLHVVNNADKNKMSIRNVGIVFSPTLNIPAPVFAIFLTDFAAVFQKSAAPNGHAQTLLSESDPKLTPEDIRSPRRQMFSDLPTPALNQSFPKSLHDRGPNAGANQSAGDLGFIPVQPAYESRRQVPQMNGQQTHTRLVQQSSQNAEYGSLNHMLAPENSSSAKAKRRESSMIFLG